MRNKIIKDLIYIFGMAASGAALIVKHILWIIASVAVVMFVLAAPIFAIIMHEGGGIGSLTFIVIIWAWVFAVSTIVGMSNDN